MRFLGVVSEFLASLGLNTRGAASFRNRIINGDLRVNQWNVATTSTAYAAGVFTRDRWKAGSAGCTASFSVGAGGDVTASITAGTLVQIVESNIYLREGGSFVLSWEGSAQARAYSGAATGSYASSPLKLSNVAAADLTIEFSTGTVGLVQLEPGISPTAFERRDDELRRCQRYYETGSYAILGNGAAAGQYAATTVTWAAPKRSSAITMKVNTTYSENANTTVSSTNGADSFYLYATSIGPGNILSAGSFTAACEL